MEHKLTEEEAAWLVTALTRMVEGVQCIHCGADVRVFEQVGRSYYARPCNHRQGQGSAQFFNTKIAAKRGLEVVQEASDAS